MALLNFSNLKEDITEGSGFFSGRKKLSIVVLVVLILAIPLAVWLLQRTQIFSPKAVEPPIQLVSEGDTCVVSTDPNKVTCVSFPIKLTSPLGPPVQSGGSCNTDTDCPSGDTCFKFEDNPGTCKASDTVCAQAIVRACHDIGPSCETCLDMNRECVDFPSSCYVPPGWTIQNGRNSPSPTVSSSPSASPSSSPVCTSIALSKNSTINSGSSITWTYTYPESTKITSINFPGQAGLKYSVNGQTSASGEDLSADFGEGQSQIQFTVMPDSACAVFTAPFTMINSCGTTLNDFVGMGTKGAYGAVCQEPQYQLVSEGDFDLTGSVDCTTGVPRIDLVWDRSDGGLYTIERTPDPIDRQLPGQLINRPIMTNVTTGTTYDIFMKSTTGKVSDTIKITASCPVAQGNQQVAGVSVVSAQQIPLNNGLVSYWKFNEESGGSAVDAMGVSNGVVTNASVIDGKSAKARQIGTSDSEIKIVDNSAYNLSAFTIAGWVKPTNFGDGNFASIFSRRTADNAGGVYLEYAGYPGASDGAIQCHVNLTDNGDTVRVVTGGDSKVIANQWNFVACSYDGSNLKVYVNNNPAVVGAKNGTMSNPSDMEIFIGKNPIENDYLNGGVDEIMIWNRALSDSEIGSLAAGNFPQVGATSSPSATATATSSPAALTGTLYYKLAESEAGLAGAPAVVYSEHPTIANFAFSDPSPGSKQIWAQFIGPGENNFVTEHISVDLVEPEPIISSLDCSVELGKQDLKLTLNGSRFGNGSGSVTANDKDAQVLNWSDSQVVATIKPDGNLEDGRLFKVALTRADGRVLPETSCLVNTTIISLGARLFCREPGKFDVNNVKVTLVDQDANKVDEVVTIDKDGLLKGLKTVLQAGKAYAISIDAPFSLSRNSEFVASSGTNVIAPEEASAFILPIGDIAPVILQDGKINTLDRAELTRQWSVLGNSQAVNKTGDFNRDSRINSIDWACMRYDFNGEDDPLLIKAPTTPVPSPSPNPSTTVSSPSPSPAASGQRVAYFLLHPEGNRTYSLNQEFGVDVDIWSGNEAANLFKAVIEFDPQYLEVVRIDEGDALTNWAEKYSDNSTGDISLTAGLPSPGLKTSGSEANMAKIIFKTKNYVNGSTVIRLTSDSKIYSNSDNTNIMGNPTSAEIIIPFPPD